VIRRAKDKTLRLFDVCSIDLPDQIDNARDISVAHPELETYIRELQFTEKQMIEPLRNKYPSVHFYFDLARCSGIGYYSGLCYKLTAHNATGNRYQLAGGGACDWTRKLLNSKREHLITSGFGTEMFSKLFSEEA
jgi:histidyl-tRNA synthetase